MTPEGVPNLRGNGMTTAAFILGPLFGAGVVVAGLIWMAAKYPERSEFEAVRNVLVTTQQDTAIHKFRLDGIQNRVDAIDVKLDRLLEENRKPRPR